MTTITTMTTAMMNGINGNQNSYDLDIDGYDDRTMTTWMTTSKMMMTRTKPRLPAFQIDL